MTTDPADGSDGSVPRVWLAPLRGLAPSVVARWQALAEQALEPNPFAGPDVALSAAEHLADGAEARLLAAERDGELVFALPVVVRRVYRHVPLRTVQAWRHAHCFLGTPLVAPRGAAQTWRAVLVAVRRHRWGRWLVVDDVPLHGPVVDALRAAVPRPAAPQELERRRRPVVRPDGEGPRVADPRRDARRRRRLVATLGVDVGGLDVGGLDVGGLDVVDHATTDGALPAAVDRFLALEADGWKGRAGTALASDDGHAAFFAAMCRRQAARGALALLALETDRHTLAMLCVLAAGDAAFLFKIGHDGRFARASPGIVLLDEALARLRAGGRVDVVDSCGDRLSERVRSRFGGARTMGTLVVPAGLAGALVAPALPALVAVWRGAASGVARVRGDRPGVARARASGVRVSPGVGRSRARRVPRGPASDAAAAS